VADRGNQRVQEFDEQLQFVRERGGYGFEPGHFVDPRAVVADRGPRIYILDTPAGRVQTLDSRREPESVIFNAQPGAGFGSHRLISMAVDAAGQVYLSDREDQSILVLGPQGDSLGVRGGYGSGPGQFRRIGGLAVGTNGEVWVLDEARLRLVHLDPAGGFISEFAVADDSLKGDSRPSAVAVSSRPLIAVADAGLRQVHLYTPEGALLGELQPPGGSAWDRPTALAWWGDTLAVADEGTQRVTLFKPAVPAGASH
jgi:streptogramin lyase